MDYDQLAYDLQHAPGVRLLKADHAALIISFLHRQFKREQRIFVPLQELAERLTATIEAVNEQAPGSYPRPAQSYLTEWADEQHHYIRNATPASSDTPLVELTAETERVIGWIEELHGQPFVGTESRFLHIVQLLREIMQKSTVDPVERLAQLEQRHCTGCHSVLPQTVAFSHGFFRRHCSAEPFSPLDAGAKGWTIEHL